MATVTGEKPLKSLSHLACERSESIETVQSDVKLSIIVLRPTPLCMVYTALYPVHCGRDLLSCRLIFEFVSDKSSESQDSNPVSDSEDISQYVAH